MNNRPPRLPQYMSDYQRALDRERLEAEIEQARQVIEANMARLAVIDSLNKK